MKNNGHSFRTSHAVEVYSGSRELWDTPIFESQSFVVLPTVGALVEGWLMVIPKTPTLSFARLSPSQFTELDAFLRKTVPKLESIYGPISVFEHGPAMTGSSVGCGVDYAHLHLVPTQCDLLAGAQKISPNIRWNQIESINAIRSCASLTEGYWFLKQDYRSDLCFLGQCESGSPTSQLFRRVIANSLGTPSLYDWKLSLGETNVAATVEKLTRSSVVA